MPSGSKSKSEQWFWAEHLREVFCDWQPTRIESGRTTGGLPDVNMCDDRGRDIWLENKVGKPHSVKFRPAQIGWHMKRRHLGSVTFIGVYHERSHSWVLFSNKYIEEVVNAGVHGKGGRWFGVPLDKHAIRQTIQRMLESDKVVGSPYPPEASLSESSSS